jgi:hypothetical protein
VGLDRRATFTLADRRQQYDAAMRVSALFGRMSALVARINAVRGGADAVAADAADPLARQAATLSASADALRKQIVATREGGAITGEERLREQMDYVYGQIISTEAAPPRYALERVDVLESELAGVESAFERLSTGELARFNDALQARGRPAIELASVEVPTRSARGGNLDVLSRGLVGTRLTVPYSALRTPSRRKR